MVRVFLVLLVQSCYASFTRSGHNIIFYFSHERPKRGSSPESFSLSYLLCIYPHSNWLFTRNCHWIEKPFKCLLVHTWLLLRGRQLRIVSIFIMMHCSISTPSIVKSKYLTSLVFFWYHLIILLVTNCHIEIATPYGFHPSTKHPPSYLPPICTHSNTAILNLFVVTQA